MAQKATGKLTHTVALRVVQTIAPRVDYPLNIMDERGIIIASSDPKRLGNPHPDALRALSENRTIVTAQADPVSGQLPGVNVPLYADGVVQGVVGVTGAPQEVASLAQLISLTVQLLLTQHEEHVRSTVRATQISDMLSGLVSGSASDEALAEQLEQLGLSAPWSLSLLLDEDGPEQYEAALTINNARWVLSSGPIEDPASARAILGPPRTQPSDLLVDAENLRTLGAVPALVPAAGLRELWNEDMALSAARAPEAYCRSLARRTAQISAEHAFTLLALAASSTQSEAIARLTVHRNTLIQRMDRIKQVTGSDPRVPGELMALLSSIYARVRLGEMHIFQYSKQLKYGLRPIGLVEESP
ncbi:sugar diacid recognition domain-containing protein [Glutamicibacter soli]|nr:sugar diacid recognition domain-containing protein [Glutamicibacter soli]